MGLINLDIINKIQAKEMNLPEKVVELVNREYWNSIKEHIRKKDVRPINILHIGYLRLSKPLIRKRIHDTIAKIRTTQKSTKFKEDSLKRQYIIESYKKTVGELFKIRNHE